MRIRVRPGLIFVHRWLGVALVCLFLLWFPSGIVMMYWSFPEVTPAERLARSTPLDPATIRVTPAEAFQRTGLSDTPSSIVLATFDGRPMYRFADGDGETMIYADSAEQQLTVPAAMRRRIAASWTRRPAREARESAVLEVDQWTVGGVFQRFQPLWKYTWPTGDEVYVAGSTGEVVQATTRTSRLAAYLGAIPHWFYFTPLRKHPAFWSRVVIWTSAAGTVAALLGLIVGVWMYSPRKRYRYDGAPTGIPYRGQKRWHTIFGLAFGVVALTWAFSGMLSMEPFPRQPTTASVPSPRELTQMLRRAAPPDAFDARAPAQALELLGRHDIAELELISLAGGFVYLATPTNGESAIVPLNGPPRAMFELETIAALVREAAIPEAVADVRTLDRYDAYYLDRKGELPLPVIRAQLTGDAARYYIDPRTARVVGFYSGSGWIERWLYHGLHSLQFPWLYNQRPLWDVLVLTLLGGGTALCVTSLILAWRVLGRTFAVSPANGLALADELPSRSE